MNVKYRRDEGDFLSDPSLYRQLVRSLNYLTITQLDISFVVIVSQIVQAPCASPSHAMIRVLKNT